MTHTHNTSNTIKNSRRWAQWVVLGVTPPMLCVGAAPQRVTSPQHRHTTQTHTQLVYKQPHTQTHTRKGSPAHPGLRWHAPLSPLAPQACHCQHRLATHHTTYDPGVPSRGPPTHTSDRPHNTQHRWYTYTGSSALHAVISHHHTLHRPSAGAVCYSSPAARRPPQHNASCHQV